MGWSRPFWSALSLWHSTVAWGSGEQMSCAVVGGLRYEVSPGSGMPGTASKSYPGVSAVLVSSSPALGALRGPQAKTTCTSFLGLPKQIHGRYLCSRCWRLEVWDQSVGRSSSETGALFPCLVLPAPVAPGPPWLGATSLNLCLPARLLPGPQSLDVGPTLIQYDLLWFLN